MPKVDQVYITGEEIRKRRRGLDITQKEFAQMLDCHQPNVARWEAGEVRISRRIAKQVIKLLEQLEIEKEEAA